MKRLVYSPTARKKLIAIKRNIQAEHGNNAAERIIAKITKYLRNLEVFELQGVSVAEMFGIDTDYRYLYVEHNYAFYRIENGDVRVVDILNEREDFMQILFGIKTTSQETEEYWQE